MRTPAPCARCGRAPRLPDLYLCRQCLEDWETDLEVRTALEDPEPRRFVVTRFHWYGQWGNLDEPRAGR